MASAVGGILSWLRGGNNGNGAPPISTKAISYPSQGQFTFWPGSDQLNPFDYSSVGDGSQSSVVAACLNWLMRTFPEAPCIVERKKGQMWELDDQHPIEELLEQPNPYYDGRVLWMSTVMDFSFGEAFWLKLRNRLGKVVQLWWIPRQLMTPRWFPNAPEFIDHYDYQPGTGKVEVPVEDVVHFRFGMDPQNIRRGYSQLQSVIREVYTDDQANRFTAALLRNLGVIGVVVAPKEGVVAPADVTDLKEYLRTRFTGERRGESLVMSRPTEVHLMQYNLQGFDVGPIRDVSEERVCAALGLPAAVVGFGTGLQQTKVGATMREMIQLAWRGALMPMQKIMAGELKRSLLPDFQSNTGLFRIRFDASQVHALWEDDQQKAARIGGLFKDSVITLEEARRELGYAIDETQNFYLRAANMSAVPADQAGDPPKPVPVPVPAVPPAPSGDLNNG